MLRAESETSHHYSLGFRVVAAFEAAKGLVVVLAGFGVLLLIHRDLQAIAERLVAHLHLNPASLYPRIFLRAATDTTPGRLKLLALDLLKNLPQVVEVKILACPTRRAGCGGV